MISVMKMTLRIVFIFFITTIFNFSFAREILKGEYNQVTDKLEIINQLTSHGGCNKVSLCPKIVSTLVSEDRENVAIVLKNQHDSCGLYVNPDKNSEVFSTAKDLSQNLSEYQLPILGSETESLVNRCIGSNVVQSKEAVSKFYYYLARLETSQAADLEEIAEIDRILGADSVLSKTNCGTLSFEITRSRCEELKKDCKIETNGLAELAAQSKQDENRIQFLNQEINELKSKIENTDSKDLKSEKDQLSVDTAELALIYSRNPILQGDIFLKEKDTGYEKAIQDQLLQRRKDLYLNLGGTVLANDCLNGRSVTRGCSTDQVRNFIEKNTESLPNITEMKKGRTIQEAFIGNQYLKMQQCLHDAKVELIKNGNILKGTAFTIASLIISWPLAAVGSAATAAGTAVDVTLAARGMQVATALSEISNLGNMTVQVSTAVEHCSKDKKLIQGKGLNSGSACQTKTVLSSRKSVKEFDDCALQATLGFLSVAPAVLGAKKIISNNSTLNPGEVSATNAAKEVESVKNKTQNRASLPNSSTASSVAGSMGNLSRGSKEVKDLVHERNLSVVKYIKESDTKGLFRMKTIKKDELHLPIDDEIKNLRGKIESLKASVGSNTKSSEIDNLTDSLAALESFRETALFKVQGTDVKLVHSAATEVKQFAIKQNSDPSTWNWGPHSGQGVYTYIENGFDNGYANNTHGRFKYIFKVPEGAKVLDITNANMRSIFSYFSKVYKTELDSFVRDFSKKELSDNFKYNWNIQNETEKTNRLKEMAEDLFLIEKIKNLVGNPDVVINLGPLHPPEVIITNQSLLKNPKLIAP